MPLLETAEFINIPLDYLVVGGGAAGLTVAARLSELPGVTVGLIEAGTHETNVPQITTPGMIGSMIANPTYDWTFFSTPQPLANNRPVLQPRGKGLGGSTLINFTGVNRASKEELDAIEQLGNKGWNWDSLLHYMKKSEKTVPPDVSAETAQKFALTTDWSTHGSDGPVFKVYPKVLTEVQATIFDTFETLGVQRNPNANNGVNIGSLTTFSSVDPHTATRSSAYTAYYAPNAERPNFVVLTGAHVTKVVFEPTADGLQRAVGVEFVKDGTITTLTGIRRDVILAGGTFQTPQLLELSGIGNPDVLAKHNIKTVIDLPGVGENLQDHMYVPTVSEVQPHLETIDILWEEGQFAKYMGLYYAEKEGYLSTIPAPGFTLVPLHSLFTDSEREAWQARAKVESQVFLEKHTHPALRSAVEKQLDFQLKWFADRNQVQAEVLNFIGHQPIPGSTPVPGKRYTTLIIAIMHPLTRGSVHLASSDPLAAPAIDPNYFANPADFDLLLQLLKFTLKFYRTAPLGELFKANVLPPPEVAESGDEEALKEWVRQWVGPVYHPVGTAAMLPREDGGVVDPSLKVYGTSNLRVVDASILPFEISCHSQTVVYAVAEKAADIIKAEIA
ncbi:alcohol oxidase [Pluteus cervinus]|uniref:Alcohol oxidase n=1 Tax=Pluteus cervinus TaxID=181527 RepID=A0ACD3A6A5_9AGAR|nr:alcohol oxidase [Pluteus cervinus]